MSIIFNSTNTANTINRAIDNSQGTTTTTQGATSNGLIISEDLTPVVQCVNGYTNPLVRKTISGAPPLTFHAVDGVTTWIINGNVSSGNYCGDVTKNLFNYKSVYSQYINANGDIATTANNIMSWNTIPEDLVNKTITISCYIKSIDGSYIRVQGQVEGTYINGNEKYSGQSGYTQITITPTSTEDRWRIIYGSGTPNVVINSVMVEVSATRTSYEPYGYKVPIKCGGITTTAYIDAPLRMSDGETPVFDIMSFDGTITRNCDTDGTPLETPTTETYTPITVQTSWGYNTFDVMTTVKPSSVSVTYTDN